MLLIYVTPLLPEFLTVVIPAHIAASSIFVMFYFWLTSEDKFPNIFQVTDKESLLLFFFVVVSSDVVVNVSICKNKQTNLHRTAYDSKLCGFARAPGAVPAAPPGQGMGFCCATLPGAVAGQAAGAGVSQELSGTGAGPWGALVFGQGRGGFVKKLCQPLAIHGSPPLGKSSCMVGFDWDTECTAPRHDGSWVQSSIMTFFPTCSVLGNVAAHRMEAMRCPTACVQYQGSAQTLPTQHMQPLGAWTLSQPLRFKPGQEIVATAEPWARAT
ncbi:hypothetical protein EK904_008974 [Melospiza melodia maxima]|nr:hypothetical protein EK904_008974 [Melospiza melodia maxima]